MLPDSVMSRIAAFQDGMKTGQIILHLKEGRIMQVDANEIVKVKEGAVDTNKERVLE